MKCGSAWIRFVRIKTRYKSSLDEKRIEREVFSYVHAFFSPHYRRAICNRRFDQIDLILDGYIHPQTEVSKSIGLPELTSTSNTEPSCWVLQTSKLTVSKA
jgi:hypothetical protein